MADALRGSMDAAEYKHVVLGLIFLKYISDAFEEQHAKLEAEKSQGADPEDPDEYRALNIFWVPPEARWSHLKAQAKQPTIGQLVDDAMSGIERDNVSLKGVLPKDYARPALDKQRLGQLIDLISNIRVGDAESRSKDVLGRIYEYFLSQFASAEGKKGGEFYTPRSVVKLLVEMIEPYNGRVYDPCCGSSGMFVQSVEFIHAHKSGNGNGGKAKSDISIYGQESNYTTWRLAKMNLALRGIDGQIGHGDTFHTDRHPDLKADFILAIPPFNISDWGGDRLRDDKRWQFGKPPAGNANFAWVQHIIYHLAPNGIAGFVLANGSMSSNQSGEGEIRKHIIEADLVDCMIALPGQLFYSTQIPACLWFLARDKSGKFPSPRSRGEGKGEGRFRDRRGEVLFIDTRKLGLMADRTHRELTDDEIARIARTYHSWRGSSLTSSPSPSMLIMGHISPRWTLNMFCGILFPDGRQRGGVWSSFYAHGCGAYQRGGARSSRVVAGGSGTQRLRLARLARRQRQAQGDKLPSGAGTPGEPRRDRFAAAAPQGALCRAEFYRHRFECASKP
jgi:type I restriction enzyme M protein